MQNLTEEEREQMCIATAAEIQRENQLAGERLLPELLKYRKDGDWDNFIFTALYRPETMEHAFYFFDEVPDELKYDFAINAYMHRGDSIPAVRKAVRSAWKYGKPDLPEELKDLDYITVYRAGEEPLTLAKYRISWTTSIDVAKFFYGRHSHPWCETPHIYTGKIKPSKVIAYTDERKEKEIMQYRNVYAIEDITDTVIIDNGI